MQKDDSEGRGHSVSDFLREELRRLSRYYGLVKCYVKGESKYDLIECRLLPKYIIDDRVAKGLRVCNERSSVCIDVDENERVVVLEVVGKRIFLVSDECERVKRNQKIAYVLTGKGEFRTIKSPVNGYILLYNEILGGKAERYQVFIVVRE
ncbi:MAG: DUF2118 domain-containing protein [Desulfurococcales archaeon]|nr:DUF2118 domain-containing protein [Desulfurococcales archaeon]